MRLQILLLFSTISFSQSDSSCSQHPPDSLKVSVVVMKEQTRGFFITSKSSSNLTNPTSEVNMVSAVSEQCPNNCIFRMKTYVANHGGSLLHVRDPYPALIPYGYNVMPGEQNLFCARESGYCGATVPLYRHYRLDSTGIHHTYSFNSSSIESYVREPIPLCYVWPTVAAREPRSSSDESCTRKDRIESKHLIELKEYKSDQIVFFTDRYLTTLSSSDLKLAKYVLEKSFGKVLPNSHQSSCDCLVKLKQQMETPMASSNSNHRLSTVSEKPSLYDNYVDEGESFFCAKTEGACGATVPLHRHFNIIHMNYVYSTNSVPMIFAIPSPSTPLCYIWPSSYNFTSIAASTIASTTTTYPTTSSSKNVTASPKLSANLAADLHNNLTSTTTTTTTTSPTNVTVVKPSVNILADLPHNATSTTSPIVSLSNSTSALNTTSSTVKLITNASLTTSTTSITMISNTTVKPTTSAIGSSSNASTTPNVALHQAVTTVTSTLPPSGNSTQMSTKASEFANSTLTTKFTENPLHLLAVQKRQRSPPIVTNDNPSQAEDEWESATNETIESRQYGPSYAVVVIRTANETSNN